jgi:dTDP-4-dehydrorhamnose 3,5-epimerase
MPFRFQRLGIPDVILVETQSFGDDRDSLAELYKMSEFSAHGISQAFVQDNLSRSVRGTLRGLHYQEHPKAQGKLVGVLKGRIFDVAVDIRVDSPTCGKWVGEDLSAENRRMLYVPPGFAHGFCVLSDKADVFYRKRAQRAPSFRGVVNAPRRIKGPPVS